MILTYVGSKKLDIKTVNVSADDELYTFCLLYTSLGAHGHHLLQLGHNVPRNLIPKGLNLGLTVADAVHALSLIHM